jgi:antirestriction protein ArdC
MPNTEKQDVYTRITDKIIASLEQGVRPWIQSWNAEHAAGKITRPLRHNGRPYSGINILMLWASAMEQGFAAPIWMTFKQALELNAHVRKGEKGSLVVYASAITRTEHDDATGEETEREIPFLKGYTVFNVEQIDGLPDRYYAKVESKLTPVERIAQAEEFFSHMTVALRHGGNRAYYAQELDYVQMPVIEAFRDESYYATLGHEFIHSTKHPSRLQRDFGRKQWGDEGYPREELVAELESAFLCADLELTPEVRDDHVGYIDSWLQVLKNDKRCVVQAASYAQKAVDYLHGLRSPTARVESCS